MVNWHSIIVFSDNCNYELTTKTLIWKQWFIRAHHPPKIECCIIGGLPHHLPGAVQRDIVACQHHDSLAWHTVPTHVDSNHSDIVLRECHQHIAADVRGRDGIDGAVLEGDPVRFGGKLDFYDVGGDEGGGAGENPLDLDGIGGGVWTFYGHQWCVFWAMWIQARQRSWTK